MTNGIAGIQYFLKLSVYRLFNLTYCKAMKINKLILIVFIGITNFSFGQEVVNTSFTNGEKLTYIASFYMSSLWTDIAEINMEVSEVNTKTQELYRLKCVASTYQSWDSYFKIRDLYESYVDKVTVKPYLFKRQVDEGGYILNIKYLFKWNSLIAKATIQKRTNPEKELEVKISPNTYDLVSVLYMIRNVDFSTKKPGDLMKINVLIDAKEEIVTVKYRGKESVNVAGMGNKECYKLSVALKDESILKGKDLNNIWLTADKNRVPVLIKAEIPVGSVQIRLANTTGLKN